MCSKIQLKRATPFLSLTAITLVCFAVASLAQAVVPAPDGGYPGGDTAAGQNALLSLTTRYHPRTRRLGCIRSEVIPTAATTPLWARERFF